MGNLPNTRQITMSTLRRHLAMVRDSYAPPRFQGLGAYPETVLTVALFEYERSIVRNRAVAFVNASKDGKEWASIKILQLASEYHGIVNRYLHTFLQKRLTTLGAAPLYRDKYRLFAAYFATMYSGSSSVFVGADLTVKDVEYGLAFIKSQLEANYMGFYVAEKATLDNQTPFSSYTNDDGVTFWKQSDGSYKRGAAANFDYHDFMSLLNHYAWTLGQHCKKHEYGDNGPLVRSIKKAAISLNATRDQLERATGKEWEPLNYACRVLMMDCDLGYYRD